MYATMYDTFKGNPKAISKIFKILDVNAQRINNFDDAKSELQNEIDRVTNYGKDIVKEPFLRDVNRQLDGVKLTRSIIDPDENMHEYSKKILEYVKTNNISSNEKEIKEFLKKPTEVAKNSLVEEIDDDNFKGLLDAIPIKKEGGAEGETKDSGASEDDTDIFTENVTDITINDRVTFIAVTFLIRMVCTFLIDWAVSSGMVDSFNHAFMYYVGLYSLILVFTTFVVSNNEIGIQMLMYYMNTTANGYSRIGVHLLVVLLLLPILFVVNEKNVGGADMMSKTTFEFKQQISKSVSNFTLIIWMLTSVIAMRF